MTDPLEPYELRDPIHGFVRLSQLEWDIINQPLFQRLRRIRQLAWTDMIYPGATHSRFEHSIGVMHVSARLFDAILRRSKDILQADYGYDDGDLSRQRKIIRLAALFHDLGHGPFSHAGEEVLPLKPDSTEKYVHEDYSDAALMHGFSDLLNSHDRAQKSGIRIDDIRAIFSSRPARARDLVWRDLISGQMDADRMDYLLRDAYHAGVRYGHYDLDRLVYSIQLCPDPEGEGHHIGVDESGIHAVEGLLIARFMMFAQLYFHKTRAIYDYHLIECLRALLRDVGGSFPSPNDIASFLKWDDWKVLGAITDGSGGEHGDILRDRTHYRMVYDTPEVASPAEFEKASEIQSALAHLGCVARDAEKSWYKSGPDEIKVLRTSGGSQRSVPLATLSPVVRGLVKINQRRLYVPSAHREAAEKIVKKQIGEIQDGEGS